MQLKHIRGAVQLSAILVWQALGSRLSYMGPEDAFEITEIALQHNMCILIC